MHWQHILQSLDKNPDNDIHEPTGRDEFRMHQGSGIGCITNKEFARIAEILEGTSKGPEIMSPWGNRPRLGIITVTK